MNAQQELVAYWQFCESRGLQPSIRKCVEHVRAFGIKVDDKSARRFLAAFTAVAPHKKSRVTAVSPHKSSTNTAHALRKAKDVTAHSPRLRARNKVSLFSDSPPSLRSGETPRVEEWTVPVRATAAELNARELRSLTPDERYDLARFHALEFANCTRSEATNRSRAIKIATSIAALTDRLSRDRATEDVTVREYVAYGRHIVARTRGSPWYRPYDIIAEIKLLNQEETHANPVVVTN